VTLAIQGNPIDIQRESNGQLSLVFDYRVDAAPSGSVSLGVQCGANCAGTMPIEEQLRKAAKGQWQQMKVLLQCFEKHGANMHSVSAPLAITSSGSLKLGIGNVRLDTGLSDAITCN
jgi:beta-glucosidase